MKAYQREVTCQDLTLYPAASEVPWIHLADDLDRLLEYTGAGHNVRLAARMRVEGSTYGEIGECLQISRQSARQLLADAGARILASGILATSQPVARPALQSRSTQRPRLGRQRRSVSLDRAQQLLSRPEEGQLDPAPPASRMANMPQSQRTEAGPSAHVMAGAPQTFSDVARHGHSGLSRAPLYSRRPSPWRQALAGTVSSRPIWVCSCCEARLRSLTPAQSFGWRDVYDSEVHRYTLRD